MKQILLHKGLVSVEDVPAPARDPKTLLVEVSKSLISTGTELSTIHASNQSFLTKAQKKPTAVMKVLGSVVVNGMKRTFYLIKDRLNEWSPLGYSCTGHVIAVGEAVGNFQVGDRVACGGGGLANHAEIVAVPAHLTVKVPPAISDQSAAFVTLGAIALQGVRRADVRIGETVCVIGLGLLGQITVQLLASSGCNVIGLDPDSSRIKKASLGGLRYGTSSIKSLLAQSLHMTSGQGVDATIITASTLSDEPAQTAFEITRKKGRIVVVGAVGMNLQRSPFYEKEQDFLISCSYGPGRYDPAYERYGQDYPYAYVRWTENRNMAAFLGLIEKKKVDVESLIDQEVPVEEAGKAYKLLEEKSEDKPLAIVLSYPRRTAETVKTVPVIKASFPIRSTGKIRLGLIGVGQFTRSTHIPNLRQLEGQIEIIGVCAASSATATTAARQLRSTIVSTDYRELLSDPRVDAVLIATRHDKHAQITEDAIRAGKHIYLEKPLALEMRELERLDHVIRSMNAMPVLMVGFNRRFAPMAKKMKEYIDKRSAPLMATYRVNAGELPMNHWTKTGEGGGRLKGEACHMVDFFQYLVRSPLKDCAIRAIHPYTNVHLRPDENFSAQFTYADGSLCNLIYTSLGHMELPKENIEAHWGAMSAVLDDFKKLRFFGISGDNLSLAQDKGHVEALKAFIKSIQNGISFPTPWEQLVETTAATIRLDQDVWGRLS
ncbi:MAG: bi-domain-containing oxidoreductase [Elusimicrobia bacterium]|nr:bi-domain-containing oxidoreductase [Candidatus Obscuribacterium magneticum]